MTTEAIGEPADEQALLEQIQSYRHDPLGFVMFNYPWGIDGTPLAGFNGPRRWQRVYLEQVGAHCIENYARLSAGETPRMWRGSRVSGRGIGKSAEVSMLNHWFMSCYVGASAVLTANNETQLKSRTMPEVKKWFSLGLNSHWFQAAGMHIRPAEWFRKLVELQLRIDCAYYYLQAQLWSEEQPDAFAGLHNFNGVMLTFDEASGIPASIWDVSEGFFSEPVEGRFWHAFSNGRRGEGNFWRLHNEPGGYGRRWRSTDSIDSRAVEGTDRAYFQELVDTHGEDSNIVRVEVLGRFPRAEDDKAIPLALVEDATDRDVKVIPGAAILWGVDPGRFGDDPSALFVRQGNVQLEAVAEWRKLDTMQLTGRVKAKWDDTPTALRPEEILVDEIGIGAGVVDRLRELGLPARGVNVSESPALGERYLNLRAELWFHGKDWLTARNCKLLDDPVLRAELCSVGYEYTSSGKLKLEAKESMRRGGRPSPNRADALMLTFAATAATAAGFWSSNSPRLRRLRRGVRRLG